MQDLELNKPDSPESLAPLTAPSALPSPKISLEDMTQSHLMLTGFRDAVREGSFQGQDTRSVALGLDFLERMIQSSRMQLDMAKAQEKETMKAAKLAIKEAGGEINGESGNASRNVEPAGPASSGSVDVAN